MPIALDAPESHWAVSAGFEAVTNDPFQDTAGVRVGGLYAPRPWAEIGAALAYYPRLDDGAWTDPEVDPDWFSPIHGFLSGEWLVGQAQVQARVHAVRVDLDGEWRAGLGVSAGMGVVLTQEYVSLSGALEWPDASQFHTAAVVGAFWEVRTGEVAVRMRYESSVYLQVDGPFTEVRDTAVLGAEVLRWF